MMPKVPTASVGDCGDAGAFEVLWIVVTDVVEARVLDGYRVYLRFEDGIAGELDLGDFIRFEGVFAPLRNKDGFAKLRVDPDAGTIVWPNGADLDPDVLYSAVSGEPIETTTGDGS